MSPWWTVLGRVRDRLAERATRVTILGRVRDSILEVIIDIDIILTVYLSIGCYQPAYQYCVNIPLILTQFWSGLGPKNQ